MENFNRKAMVRVFYKYNTLLEEVIQVTEPILELEYEKIERLERQYKESAAPAAQKERELSQKDEEIAELKKMLWILQNPREEES